MGMGDELLAAGQARARQEAGDARRVRILGADKQPRWDALWEGNPRIAGPHEPGDFQWVINGPGARPYIAAKHSRCWTWRDFVPTPGEIHFTRTEKDFAATHRADIVIEPTLKPRASPNKHWGADRWLEFVRLATREGLALTQLAANGQFVLPGVRWVQSPDFRHACAVLARARAYVGHEGGLHHAAAAVGVPGVVIYGGFISPRQTGYALHSNLFTGGEPCGMRVHCPHCARAMAQIEPEQVLAALQEKLRLEQAA